MIRKMEKKDLDRVSKIWLDTNIKAHDFIPAQYLGEKLWTGKRNASPGRNLCLGRGRADPGFCGPV